MWRRSGQEASNVQQAPAPPSITAAVSPNAVTLLRSGDGPTTCTVYEPGRATQVIFESQQLDVTADVVQDTGFRPITAAEQATGASACGSLVGVGWREQARRAHRRPRRH
jgi:hypothetical protein